MRYFIILTSILLFMTSSCKTNTNSNKNSIIQIEKVSLSEQTRGTIRIFTLYSGKLESSINGNSDSKEIPLSDWSKISENAENINLEKISKLESPSTKRYSDAALSTKITIYKNGTEYQSSDFDSGNPPAELKNLYNEIQRIIETKKSR